MRDLVSVSRPRVCIYLLIHQHLSEYKILDGLHLTRPSLSRGLSVKSNSVKNPIDSPIHKFNFCEIKKQVFLSVKYGSNVPEPNLNFSSSNKPCHTCRRLATMQRLQSITNQSNSSISCKIFTVTVWSDRHDCSHCLAKGIGDRLASV